MLALVCQEGLHKLRISIVDNDPRTLSIPLDQVRIKTLVSNAVGEDGPGGDNVTYLHACAVRYARNYRFR